MKLKSIKLPHFNNAAEAQSTTITLPSKVIISMSQHGGVPCTPLVKAGDRVTVGQLIGSSDALISAPVHSSVAGTVKEITKIMNVFGKYNDAIVIETDLRQEKCPDIKPPVITNREEFINAVRESGSVGLGGAGFPTYVKFNYDTKTYTADTLVINGAECEPYITSDYRTFMEEGEKVVKGIELIMKYLDIVISEPFIEKFKFNGKYMGSSNQKIWYAKDGSKYDICLESEHSHKDFFSDKAEKRQCDCDC